MSTPLRFRPRVSPLPGRPLQQDELLQRLRSHTGRALLDSAAGTPGDWSWLAFDPLPARPARAELGALRQLLAQVELDGGDELPGSFHGGFVGAFSYDLGVAGERAVWQTEDPWRTPRIVGGLYCDFLVIDHVRNLWWLVLGESPGDGRSSVARRRERVESELLCAWTPEPDRKEHPELTRHVPATVHRARIELARAAIARGDFYQANLAHRFTAKVERQPDELYASLRCANPAPYMAFLEWSEAGTRGAILSASPELLLEFDGQRALTRPIKGTSRRSKDALEDAQLARALLASEKDRAELAMIVDLERNDLGRIAEVGSVQVGEFPRLETFASVHHLVADVTCTVRPGVDAIEILQSIFPGGSITGAPKLAAMRAISDLEGEGRGFFTGSLGYLDFRGSARFNILIRTLVWRPNEVSFHVGGGITWSSLAADEDEETLVKAEALITALSTAPKEKIEA